MGEAITLPKILIGIGIAVVGFLIVLKTEWFVQNFGQIDFAEKHMGTMGGTRFLIKLIGIAAIAIGFMTATGLIEQFMRWILSPLIKTAGGGRAAPAVDQANIEVDY